MPPTRAESGPQFDHLIVAVPDAEPVSQALRENWGLNVVSDGLSFDNGLANRIVPLEPPEYLEILFVADVDAFARQPDDEFKARVLAGGGLLGWALRTWDLDAIEREVGVAPDRDTKLADGSTAPWRAVAKPGSPLGFPFYIQYAATPAERMAKWRQRLAEVGHRSRPGRTRWVEVSGAAAELQAWLRPASHLDVRITAGPLGVRAAVPVGDRLLILSSDVAGGIVRRA